MVSLSIYDASGRRVRALARGTMPGGEHGVYWDGRDPSGRAMPSGVYLIRLEVTDQALTRKLIKTR
jgi:flagellar hook assembly protein FlgD